MKNHCRLSRYGGYSFLELLLVMSLVSFGLLGLIGVQNTLLVTEGNLLHRIQANLMFYDFLRWSYATADSPETIPASAYGNIPQVNENCLDMACDQSQRTVFYLRQWKCRIGIRAEGSACRDSGQPLVSLRKGDARVVPREQSLEVSIKWQDLKGREQFLRKTLSTAP